MECICDEYDDAENVPLIHCENCGWEGFWQDFTSQDSEDTICPKCGEKDNHTYVIDI